MGLYFTSPETFISNFRKRTLDEKSHHIVIKKSKNVNLGDKKSQANVKKT